MATFQEVLTKALQNGQIKMVSVNQNMLEISAETKKKAAFVKTAVPEELAKGLMQRKKVAFILHIDGDELNELSAQIDREKGESA